MTIRVGVLGAAGRMGAEVCRAVAEADGLELIAAADSPDAAGQSVSDVAGVETPLVIAPSVDDVIDAEVHVVVDFTVAAAARENLPALARAGVHAVVGTTGLDAADLEALARRFESSNCLVAPNFAIGAVLMMQFAEAAAPHFDTAEIIEFHHENKIDAPSGTATATAERMAAASDDWLDDPTQHEVYDGARGGSGPSGIKVHSVRMRGMVAHQEVILGTTGQTLVLRHDTTDRTSFMPGVVLAVRGVADLPGPGLTVGLDALL